jgi:hypothetical protein
MRLLMGKTFSVLSSPWPGTPGLIGHSRCGGQRFTHPKPTAPAIQSYVPGLGDFMTAYVQPHHVMLWLAVNAVDRTLLIDQGDSRAGAEKRGRRHCSQGCGGLKAGVGRTTAACNSCHKKARHEFLVIKVPAADPFPDQSCALH